MDGHSRRQAPVSAFLNTSPGYFDRRFPCFREPVELGLFSLDHNRRFKHDSSQLRRFVPPADWTSCSLDLRHGYKDMIHRDESIKEHIDDLLRWIMCNKYKFLSQSQQPESAALHPPNKMLKKDILHHDNLKKPKVPSATRPEYESHVFNRGLMTRLLCIPYENQDDLLVAVIRFRGTYFMCEFDTEAKKRKNEQETPKQKEMCAWGFKFEQYVTAGDNCRVPDTQSPVNTNMAFCSVAKSHLSSHSIVFGAEVDCKDVDCQKGNSYIELKTSRLIESQRQHENFCKANCGLAFPVFSGPLFGASSVYKPWKPTVCFNFLDAFFQFVKSNITKDDERCVYLLRWQPGSDITCQNVGDDCKYHFLPHWFLKWEAWDQPCSQ